MIDGICQAESSLGKEKWCFVEGGSIVDYTGEHTLPITYNVNDSQYDSFQPS